MLSFVPLCTLTNSAKTYKFLEGSDASSGSAGLPLPKSCDQKPLELPQFSAIFLMRKVKLCDEFIYAL